MKKSVRNVDDEGELFDTRKTAHDRRSTTTVSTTPQASQVPPTVWEPGMNALLGPSTRSLDCLQNLFYTLLVGLQMLASLIAEYKCPPARWTLSQPRYADSAQCKCVSNDFSLLSDTNISLQWSLLHRPSAPSENQQPPLFKVALDKHPQYGTHTSLQIRDESSLRRT